MKTIDIISFILLLAGGINWGLVGLFDFNLVEAIFGTDTAATAITYALVGLSALWQAFSYRWSESTNWVPARHRHA